MTTLQEFLNSKYPSLPEKEQVKKIIISGGYFYDTIPQEQYKNLAGNQLNLSKYPNLEQVIIKGNYLKSPLTELNLSGCGKLVELDCSRNQLTNLNLTNCINLKELDCPYNQLPNLNFLNGLNSERLTRLSMRNNNLTSDLNPLREMVNLEVLILDNNPFYGSLNPLREMVKLKWLNINDTNLDSGLEYLSESIKDFYCSADYKKNAKVQAIYNLFANDQGVGGIENFPQKLQDLKNSWIKLNFTDQEMKTWTKAGAQLNDAEFVKWLRDIKNYGPEWITNYQEDYQTLSERFKKYGLCKECNQPNTGEQWCQSCNVPRLQADFNKWTSGNSEIDQFIQKYQLTATEANKFLEWIPYEQFSNIEYLAEGGFGKVYKAKWTAGNIHHWDTWNKQWHREKDHYYEEEEDGWGYSRKVKKSKNYREVVLKSLTNSSSSTEFLQETAKHKDIDDWFNNLVPCYGLSQDPNTGNYLMVMQYMPEGNLRQYLSNKNKELTMQDKFSQLLHIAQGLKDIHQKNLAHRDFHSGNILKGIKKTSCLITDLGLCKPADEANKEDKIFGVMPYVAPEVLQQNPYTQAADVYSFGIIAYEILANAFPYHEYHDPILALRICVGLRPNLDKVKVPQICKDLIKKCWDADPQKRPSARELCKVTNGWFEEIENKKNTEFYQQYLEAKKEYNSLSQIISYKINPQTITHSKLINTKYITQQLQEHTSKDLDSFIDETIEIDLEANIETKMKLSQTKENEFDKERIVQLEKENQELKNRIKVLEEQDRQQAQILQKEPFGTPGPSKK